MAPLGKVLDRLPIRYHIYADDVCIYADFTKGNMSEVFSDAPLLRIISLLGRAGN